MTGETSPRNVIERFHAAEAAYMHAGGAGAGATFTDMASTLDLDVVLHQSPDLPWGGGYHGHAGYQRWAARMSRAFDQLRIEESRFFTAVTWW